MAEDFRSLADSQGTGKQAAVAHVGRFAAGTATLLSRVKPRDDCAGRVRLRLVEAANRAGIDSGAPALGRPTCMALPASLQHGAILSLGCIGNRVYTGIGEDEMYFVLRGKDLAALADSLTIITSANAALHDYAESRRSQLATI